MKGSPPGPSLALLAESPVEKSADPKKPSEMDAAPWA